MIIRYLKRVLDNHTDRDDFVSRQLAELPAGSLLLDAGCGSQQYRPLCKHLQYRSQDFGQYKTDDKKMLGSEGMGGRQGYAYGQLDYTGDIWNIQEKDATFDAILCTEVLEHLPFPNETIRELARLLKPGGRLILTAPSNCLRHMDPFFFYTGFSDRWYQRVLEDNGLIAEKITPVGDYFRWLAVEMARTMKVGSPVAWILVGPALLYYMLKRKTKESVDTLCLGYHVVARRGPGAVIQKATT